MTDHLDLVLATIPEQDRRRIARWLAQRAGLLAPSAVLSDEAAFASQACLLGAAADLLDPTDDDTTVDHARALLESLDQPDEPTAPPMATVHIALDGYSGTVVAVRSGSACRLALVASDIPAAFRGGRPVELAGTLTVVVR